MRINCVQSVLVDAEQTTGKRNDYQNAKTLITSGQIPFSSGRNTLFGSIRREIVTQRSVETARQARITFMRRGVQAPKKIPGISAAGRISWFTQQQKKKKRKEKLDYSFLMTSFPALLQPHSLETCSSGAERS